MTKSLKNNTSAYVAVYIAPSTQIVPILNRAAKRDGRSRSNLVLRYIEAGLKKDGYLKGTAR